MKKMNTTKRTVKKLVKNEEAVSPVIGVILMIAITVVIAAVVASFAYGIIGGVAKAPNTALVIEDAQVGKTNVTIIHHGGDTIVDAFDTDAGGNATGWNNLVIKGNGIDVSDGDWTTCVIPGGNGNANFESGEQLEINVSATVLPGGRALDSGDTISVVYKPSGDILQRVKVA